MNTVFFVDGLIVVGNGNIFERGTILVEGERIVRVSEREIPIPKSARRIELNGCSLLPGFIDCHVHLCHDGSSDPYATLRNDPAPMTEIRAIQHARSTLNGGITSVRDLGGRDGITLALRDAIRSGLIPGPRIRASDSMVCMTGGTGWLSWGKEVDGPIEVIKLVRQLIKSGVDVVNSWPPGA